MRTVVVECDDCACALTLDLTSAKADGGFHSCDIEHELRECGWVLKDGEELCDICKPATEEEQRSAERTGG